MQNIQICYRGPVMFVVTCFTQIEVISIKEYNRNIFDPLKYASIDFIKMMSQEMINLWSLFCACDCTFLESKKGLTLFIVCRQENLFPANEKLLIRMILMIMMAVMVIMIMMLKVMVMIMVIAAVIIMKSIMKKMKMMVITIT